MPYFTIIEINPQRKEEEIKRLVEGFQKHKFHKFYLKFNDDPINEKFQVFEMLKDIFNFCKQQSIKKIGFILSNIQEEYQIEKFFLQQTQIEFLDIKSNNDLQSTYQAFRLLELCQSNNLKELTFSTKGIIISDCSHEFLIESLFEMKKLEYLTFEFDMRDKGFENPYLQRKKIFQVKQLEIHGGNQIYQSYLPLFPNLIQAQFLPEESQQKFQPNLLNSNTKIENIQIQNLDNVHLYNLKNLQIICITKEFSNSFFQNINELKNLKVLKIMLSLSGPQIQEMAKYEILPRPERLILKIYTLSYHEIKQLGENKNVSLIISSGVQICERSNDSCMELGNKQFYEEWKQMKSIDNLISFNFAICCCSLFLQYIQDFLKFLASCKNIVYISFSLITTKVGGMEVTVPKEIENQFALNTNILSFNIHHHLKVSQSFKEFLLKKQSIFYHIFAFQKLISPYIALNPFLCYYDLFENDNLQWFFQSK